MMRQKTQVFSDEWDRRTEVFSDDETEVFSDDETEDTSV